MGFRQRCSELRTRPADILVSSWELKHRYLYQISMVKDILLLLTSQYNGNVTNEATVA